eukprot:Phypoly_transcript_02450.p1 GENE.Phypoly_transcript_02450~~Phypoly_transcript_02450.p1  ORF type:complete len:540 (+),score=47.86 Phypoly_transcript_02450:1036-2655(+)
MEKSFIDDESEQNTSSDVLLDDKILDTSVGSHASSQGHMVFTKGDKMMNDPIHGHILIPKYTRQFIDTRQFQRLRSLKQLGTTVFVFTGATHTRFEHSVGVSHLAGKLMQKFQYSQPELDVRNEEIQLVRLAGLCHDLGHGPFSHAFESWVHRVRHSGDWKHEQMSEKMLDYLIDENGLSQYSTDDVKFMKDLISGRSRGGERAWLFDIVSNSRNSIDVDKFDYLARDSYFIGKKSPFEFTRSIALMRVVGPEICFNRKEAFTLYEMFHARYSMFKQVYSHRTGKSIELMITDAFVAADPVLRISDQLDDAEEFISLDDSLLSRIEFSKDPNLEEARGIIRRIRKRELYRMADEVSIPKEKWDKAMPTKADIVSASSGNLTEDDIIIDSYFLNYAMKDKNPMANVRFYAGSKPFESFSISKDTVSMLIPDNFAEKNCRVFCKNEAHVCAMSLFYPFILFLLFPFLILHFLVFLFLYFLISFPFLVPSISPQRKQESLSGTHSSAIPFILIILIDFAIFTNFLKPFLTTHVLLFFLLFFA